MTVGLEVTDRESMLAAANAYYKALTAGDGQAVAALFAEDGVIDDGGGGHRSGRDEIREFIGTRADGLRLEVPLQVIAVPNRLVVYGHIIRPPKWRPLEQRSDPDGRGESGNLTEETQKMRWVFHFAGPLITHLSNSYVRYFPDRSAP